MEDEAPCRSGEVRLASIRGLGGYVLYRWPIDAGGETSPGINLLVRVLDSGEVSVAIEEDWQL